MGNGIDTGTIYDQFEIRVEKTDTVFSLYERVCRLSGIKLANFIQSLSNGNERQLGISSNEEGNYVSWPDDTHKLLMSKSKRGFISYKNIITFLKDKTL